MFQLFRRYGGVGWKRFHSSLAADVNATRFTPLRKKILATALGFGMVGGLGFVDTGGHPPSTSLAENVTIEEEEMEKDHHGFKGEVVTTKKFTYYSGQKLKNTQDVLMFAGTANPPLAEEISQYLGLPLSAVSIGRFADGEVNIKVNENVRGKDVFLIQPVCPPVNDNLMELLLLISTMRRASAKSITVVIPYYGYGRADRKKSKRTPISAKDVATMLETVGTDRVILVDVRSGQTQGFFSPFVPSDNLSAVAVGALYFAEMKDLRDPVVVAPTANSVHRAREFWETLSEQGERFKDSKMAMVIPVTEHERRAVPEMRRAALENVKYEVVGEDFVRGSDAIIVHDIIDSAVPLCQITQVLKEHGANRIFAFGSHGLFSGDALRRIHESELERVVVSNTSTTPSTPRLASQSRYFEKITWLSLAPVLAEAIRRVCENESVSGIFQVEKQI